MYVFTMPAEKWDEQIPDKAAIRRLIQKHAASQTRFQNLKEYYEGKHKIVGDMERENRLVCNHSKDIADTASSYFIGEPVSYKSNVDITLLVEALKAAEADECDGDNGLDLSIYGRAYEYIYTKEGETTLECKNLPPEHTFIVYDDTIEQRELFAVYYYAEKDDTGKVPLRYRATILTKNFKYILNIMDQDGIQALNEEGEPHFKGEVPVIEYLNNKLAIGDYELQIPLIDAYNALMSDRVTDKEQFIDSILALYGTLLADDDYSEDEDEDGDGNQSPARSAMKKLKKEKLLEMPGEGAKAEYLTRTYDEAGVEILKKAIEQDIHKFSHVPCMTDEAFGGNVSGVAMEFKLLGLENITKIKSRYYRKGLRKRLRIFDTFYQTKGIRLSADRVTAVFSRAMPKNLLEISQIVSNLWGKVGKKTLLSQIPFVADPDEELKVVEEEAQELMRQQQDLFSGIQNTSPEGTEDIKSEEDE